MTAMAAGELLGYPSLLTATAPAFTVRARTNCSIYCIPGDLGVELLSREDGVRWLATTQRDALLYAARSLSPLPEVQTASRGGSGAVPLFTARHRPAQLIRLSTGAATWLRRPAR